jgi:ABC-type multidrug transport system ATPase subunit
MVSLNIIQLTKRFGTHTVFSDVSFEQSGPSLGIAGANGSGKSTFLKCLGQLLRPNKGQVNWNYNGEALDDQTFMQKLGYAAPYINLYEELNCRENLAFLSRIRHQPDAKNAIDHWIHKVGLEKVADYPFGKLSTGQQQRLRIASALFHQPDILLLDEPGSNLDEAGHSLISEIAHSFQAPDKFLIIASNAPEELDLCQCVYSIEEEQFS